VIFFYITYSILGFLTLFFWYHVLKWFLESDENQEIGDEDELTIEPFSAESEDIQEKKD
jgi:hypothetical protein